MNEHLASNIRVWLPQGKGWLGMPMNAAVSISVTEFLER